MARPLLTVTLNAAVDKTYTVPGFTLDRVHRPLRTLTTAGGKGINVARVVHTLGGAVTATGFLGGRTGEWVAGELTREGIPARFVPVGGESRLCIAVLDTDAGTQTEVNENGPLVTDTDCIFLLNTVRELSPGCAAVVISGSAPPGVPVTFYRDLTNLAQQQCGVRAVLDASGELLRHGMDARPFLVKPNVWEASALGITENNAVDAARAVRNKYGLMLALVTDGPRGAVLASGAGVWEAAPPVVDVASAVGSGDTLLAAFLWALEDGRTLPEALQIGVGAGTANAERPGAGFCTRDKMFSRAAQTVVRQLD